MQTPDGERIATLTEQVRGQREDLRQLADEVDRARRRLHKLEGTTAALVLDQKKREQARHESQERLEARLQVVMILVSVVGLLVTAAGIIAPLVYAAVRP